MRDRFFSLYPATLGVPGGFHGRIESRTVGSIRVDPHRPEDGVTSTGQICSKPSHTASDTRHTTSYWGYDVPMSEIATSSTDKPSPTSPTPRGSSSGSSSGDLAGLSSRWVTTSSSVYLARSKQTWTGAGSAAGYVLRYMIPMRRLMLDIVGSEKEADRSLAILVAHLVKAGFSGHDKGRLRDFLVRGIRSAAKARFEEVNQDIQSGTKQNGKSTQPPTPPRLEVAQLESVDWIRYWREGILQRAWRSLERYQHACRYRRPASKDAASKDAAADQLPDEDIIHDSLRVAMSYPKETMEQWAGRVATMAGRAVTPDQFQVQVELARVRFAQQIADEVAQTLEHSDPKAIHAEIKSLGLAKAFVGVKVLA